MGDPGGFITVPRKEAGYRPARERIFDFGEVEQTLNEKDRILQASRCMDCGIPFCHWACPVGSVIPEWQDALYRNNITEAYNILRSTNSFPEITGRVCPAPCEKSCVLSINEEPVTIRENECATVEQAFEAGIIKASPPEVRSGKRVAIVGSGPAGLSAADILNRKGHYVTVFEKNDAAGGLLRYGIPDFKLNKRILDRRLEIFTAEGIEFKTGIAVGRDVDIQELLANFDAVLIAAGAEHPRDLKAEGRELDGIYFAMDFLTRQNRVVAGLDKHDENFLLAKGKKVLVIGGGDTGSDCVGTAIRQQAASVTQIEILPRPPVTRSDNNPWPYWPDILRTSSSHEEGCERRWGLTTKRFMGDNGKLKQAEVMQVRWERSENGKMEMRELPGTTELIETEMVLLAMGFLHPVHDGLLALKGLELDQRGNIKTDKIKFTGVEKLFAAGDAERGASLVVHAIESGKIAASGINEFLIKPH